MVARAPVTVCRIAVPAGQAYHRPRLLQEDKGPRGQTPGLNEAWGRPLNRGSFWSPHTRLHGTGTGSDRPQAYIDCVTRRLGPRRLQASTSLAIALRSLSLFPPLSGLPCARLVSPYGVPPLLKWAEWRRVNQAGVQPHD